MALCNCVITAVSMSGEDKAHLIFVPLMYTILQTCTRTRKCLPCEVTRYLECHSASLRGDGPAPWFPGCGSAVCPLTETGTHKHKGGEEHMRKKEGVNKQIVRLHDDRTHHEVQTVHLKILFCLHAVQTRERKQEANLEGRWNNCDLLHFF